MEPVFFTSPAEFHRWLLENHDQATEIYVGLYKKTSGIPTLTYREALDEALCFGWVDGIRKTVDSLSYTIRFTPRRKNSTWSAINIRRTEELAALGLLHESGIRAFEARNKARSGLYAHEREEARFSPAFLEKFMQDEKAWEWFSRQARYYRKVATHWVMSAVKEETRLRRLETLIEDCRTGVRIKPLRTRKNDG